MNGSFDIRLATARDAQRIAEMSRDYIEHGLGWRWQPQRILRCMHNPAVNVAVASGQHGLAGFAIMEYKHDEAHLWLLAVEPSRRRAGVATALVEWLEATASVAGIGAIFLEARFNNTAARALYRKLGYREMKVVAGRYGGREDGVLIAKDLWSRTPATHRRGR